MKCSDTSFFLKKEMKDIAIIVLKVNRIEIN